MKLKIIENDSWLKPFGRVIQQRILKAEKKESELLAHASSLYEFASGHLYYALHKIKNRWVFREWAPNATKIYLIGDFSGWKEVETYCLNKKENGNWEIDLSLEKLTHGDLYKLSIHWDGGHGERIPD